MMARNGLRALTGFALLSGLVGCGPPQSKVDDLERKLMASHARADELDQKPQTIGERVEALEAASGTLSDQVDRFDSEDWASVVGDVKDARDEVVTGVENVKAEME